MNERTILLLDQDGVLLDNALYDSEWDRLAEAAFAARVGGDPRAWPEAQKAAWKRIEVEAAARLQSQPRDERPSAAAWWDRANAEWVEDACARVGVTAPESAPERTAIAERALTVYFENTRAAFPGAAETVAGLADRYEIHMSSGNPAMVIETVLLQMGIRDRVGEPYGSDLVEAFKHEPIAFYQSILTALGVSGAQVIVVDDLDGPLAAARALGAATVKVGGNRGDWDVWVETLADLPACLDASNRD